LSKLFNSHSFLIPKGQKVAALHPGHMGFSYDGSYAEFALAGSSDEVLPAMD
jgi:hypothetical protein